MNGKVIKIQFGDWLEDVLNSNLEANCVKVGHTSHTGTNELYVEFGLSDPNYMKFVAKGSWDEIRVQLAEEFGYEFTGVQDWVLPNLEVYIETGVQVNVTVNWHGTKHVHRGQETYNYEIMVNEGYGVHYCNKLNDWATIRK